MPLAKLLDTNIRIYVARSHPVMVARRFARATPGSLGISTITWGELCSGAAKSKASSRTHSALEQFSRMVLVLPLPAEAGPLYGKVRAAPQRAGTPACLLARSGHPRRDLEAAGNQGGRS